MGHKVESFVQKDWNDIADYMERRRLHSIFQLSHIIILTSLVLYRKISGSYDNDIIMTIAKIYYIVDSSWICCQPDIVKYPETILLHHIVSLVGVVGVVYTLPLWKYILSELLYHFIIHDIDWAGRNKWVFLITYSY